MPSSRLETTNLDHLITSKCQGRFARCIETGLDGLGRVDFARRIYLDDWLTLTVTFREILERDNILSYLYQASNCTRVYFLTFQSNLIRTTSLK